MKVDADNGQTWQTEVEPDWIGRAKNNEVAVTI